MLLFTGPVPSPFGNFEYLHPDDENCGADYCHPDFAMDGFPGSPPKPGQVPLADLYVTGSPALPVALVAARCSTHVCLLAHRCARVGKAAVGGPGNHCSVRPLSITV